MFQVSAIADLSAVTYSLAGPTVTNHPNTFQVDQDGVVSLLSPISRDFPDGFDTWQLNVVARDNPPGLASRDGYCLINLLLMDINDNAPVFDVRAIEGTVDELSAGGK